MSFGRILNGAWEYAGSMFSKTNTEGQDVGMPQGKYQPGNQTHQTFLSNKLSGFRQAHDKVFNSVAVVGALTGQACLYLLLDSISTSLGRLSLVAFAAYDFFKLTGYSAVPQLPAHTKEFADAQRDLYQAYRWCVEGQDTAVTHDGRVLELLEALAPFSHDRKDLMPAGFSDWDQSEVSDKFSQLLSQVPFKANDVPNQNKYMQLFNRTLAEGKRTMFGNEHNPTEQQSLQILTR